MADFCFLKGSLVDCSSGRVQDCNFKHVNTCPLDIDTAADQAAQKPTDFCFLKGLVDCSSGRVQDCNFKHVNTCPLEEQIQKEKARQETKTSKQKTPKQETKAEDENDSIVFCFLKGIVDCSSGRAQDCNFKHVKECPLHK